MLLHKSVTDLILKVFFQVYRELGDGFLERIYEIAMLMTLRELGLEVHRQVPMDVSFRGKLSGNIRPISSSMIW
jgi:GxxExxY protein